MDSEVGRGQERSNDFLRLWQRELTSRYTRGSGGGDSGVSLKSVEFVLYEMVLLECQKGRSTVMNPLMGKALSIPL